MYNETAFELKENLQKIYKLLNRLLFVLPGKLIWFDKFQDLPIHIFYKI